MVPPVRIASLVPSATEMLFALGLGDSVVAVTHECDYPAAALELPHVTRSVIPEGLAPAEIDRQVRERTGRGEAIYELDEDELHYLEPDLIVTQAVCEVCAVSFDDVRAVAERIPSAPRVLSLDPSTLGEVLADFRRLAEAADAPEAGERLLGGGAGRLEPGQGPGGGGAPPGGRRRPHRPRAGGGRRRRASARGGARVARPAVRGRALGPADDRARRRRGPARAARREVARGDMGGDRRRAARDRGVDAVRIR